MRHITCHPRNAFVGLCFCDRISHVLYAISEAGENSVRFRYVRLTLPVFFAILVGYQARFLQIAGEIQRLRCSWIVVHCPRRHASMHRPRQKRRPWKIEIAALMGSDTLSDTQLKTRSSSCRRVAIAFHSNYVHGKVTVCLLCRRIWHYFS